MALESYLQLKILTRLRGERDVWIVNVIQAGRNGCPDILGHVSGVFFAMEIKQKRGYPSRVQAYELSRIASAGGRAAVIRSVEEAMAFIEEIRADVAKRWHDERSVAPPDGMGQDPQADARGPLP